MNHKQLNWTTSHNDKFKFKKNKALSLLLVNLNNLLPAFSMILCHLLREGKRNEGRLGYY